MSKSPLKAIRAKCIDCCGDNAKAVKWCTCHGQDGTDCPLWPYRFGKRPRTAHRIHGDQVMCPELMPDGSVDLDDLPIGLPQQPTQDQPIVLHQRPLKAIRSFCLGCVDGRGQVSGCQVEECPLHQFRAGRRPTQEMPEKVRNRELGGVKRAYRGLKVSRVA